MHYPNLMFENKAGGTRCTHSFLKRSDSLFSLSVWERGQRAAEQGAAPFQPQAEGFSTQSPRMNLITGSSSWPASSLTSW